MKYVLLAMLASSFFGCASTTTKTNQPTTMIGEVTDDISTHDTRHEHELKFKNQDTGEVFTIVDSPELMKVHENGKNVLIEANVAKSSKFLFWGGNLIVKNFRVIKETSDEIPHTYVAPKTTRTPTQFRSRIGRDRL